MLSYDLIDSNYCRQVKSYLNDVAPRIKNNNNFYCHFINKPAVAISRHLVFWKTIQ